MSDMYKQFKEFVASKPADERYYESCHKNCAVAQFAKSIDPNFRAASYTYWLSVNPDDVHGPSIVKWIVSDTSRVRNVLTVAISSSNTFGSLLSKL